MKTLIWLLASALAMPAAAASSYKAGKTSGYVQTNRAKAQTRQVSRLVGRGPSGAGGFTRGFGTRTLTGTAAPNTPAPTVPGWNSNPQPGALIRTAGMGFKTSDGGGVRNSSEYSAAQWADQILHIPQYAQNATGVGVMQGPRDTPPYPANQSGGGASSGAGGNGLFAGSGLLGLNSSGQTVTVNGPGSNNGNGSQGSH